MQCRNCGVEIAEKALICYKCGTATAEAKYKPAPATKSGRTGTWSIGILTSLMTLVALYSVYC